MTSLWPAHPQAWFASRCALQLQGNKAGKWHLLWTWRVLCHEPHGLRRLEPCVRKCQLTNDRTPWDGSTPKWTSQNKPELFQLATKMVFSKRDIKPKNSGSEEWPACISAVSGVQKKGHSWLLGAKSVGSGTGCQGHVTALHSGTDSAMGSHLFTRQT